MIGKEIHSEEVRENPQALIKYATDAKKTMGCYGTFNCSSVESAHIEMMATSTQNKRVKSPIKHYVLSFAPGEDPSSKEAKKAVKRFLKSMGYPPSSHQAVWALHRDTAHHHHIHIAVNSVNMITQKPHALPFHSKLLYLHAATRHVEFEGGWEVNKGLVKVIEINNKPVYVPDTDTAPYIKRAKKAENWNGFEIDFAAQKKHRLEMNKNGNNPKSHHFNHHKSFVEYLKNDVAPSLTNTLKSMDTTPSWDDFHKLLEQQYNVRVARVGGGLRIYCLNEEAHGEFDIHSDSDKNRTAYAKSSDLGKSFSLKNLESLFDNKFSPPDFEPVFQAGNPCYNPSDLSSRFSTCDPITDKHVKKAIGYYEAYKTSCNNERNDARARVVSLNEDRLGQVNHLASELKGEVKALPNRIRVEKMKTANSIIARMRSEVNDRNKESENRYRESYPAPLHASAFFRLQIQLGHDEFEHAYFIFHKKGRNSINKPREIDEGKFRKSDRDLLTGLVLRKNTERHVTEYFRDSSKVFSESERKLNLEDDAASADVEIAILLAAQKWKGQVQLFGTEEFKQQAIKICVQRGITVTNLELQGTVAQFVKVLNHAWTEGVSFEDSAKKLDPNDVMNQGVYSLAPESKETKFEMKKREEKDFVKEKSIDPVKYRWNPASHPEWIAFSRDEKKMFYEATRGHRHSKTLLDKLDNDGPPP